MPQRTGYENSVSFTISICLVFTVCIGLVRLWIRRTAYGRDDVVVGVATLVAFGRTATNYAALAAGLGNPWSDLEAADDLAKLNEPTVAGIALWFVALYLSKCAMVSFLSRITTSPSQIRLYHICNGVVALLGMVSLVIATASCPVSPTSKYYWAFSANSSTCSSQSARWEAITALDILSEILLLALPVHLVWKLQMRLTKKAVILAAFWVRLPALGFSLGRNYFTLKLRHSASDAGLDSARVFIWLEIELTYVIASNTLSALKTFTESFASGFGMGFTRGKGDGSYGMSDVSGSSASKAEKGRLEWQTSNGTRRGTTMPSDQKRAGKEHLSSIPRLSDEGSNPGLKLRPERDLATVTNISAAPAYGDGSTWRGNSSAGSESSVDDNVIHRETSYEIQHDQAPILPVAYSRA